MARAALLAAAARLRRGTRRGPPLLWLFSDPARLPDPTGLIRFLPRGAAVVLRAARPDVARRVARACAAHGLWLLVGGDASLAARLGAGLHHPDRPGARLLPSPWPAWRSAAVHGRAGLARARRLRALAIVSPAFATASHPGAAALGPHRWGALARAAVGGRAVALGGVTATTWRRLPPVCLAGVAGIELWRVAGPPQCLREVALRLARALPGLRRSTHSPARPR